LKNQFGTFDAHNNLQVFDMTEIDSIDLNVTTPIVTFQTE